MVLAGFGNGGAVVANITLVQRGAPDRVRGRAFTLIMSANYAVLGISFRSDGAGRVWQRGSRRRQHYARPARCARPGPRPSLHPDHERELRRARHLVQIGWCWPGLATGEPSSPTLRSSSAVRPTGSAAEPSP